MSGLVKTVDISELDVIVDKLRGLPDRQPILMRSVAALVRSQTKERIDTEKRAPDGTEWPDWSERYAARRKSHHSLLMGEGNLLLSINEQNTNVGDDFAEVGSNLVYAAAQDQGYAKRNLPAREFLGLSDGNKREIEVEIADWLGASFA